MTQTNSQSNSKMASMRSFPNFALRKGLIIQVAPTGLHRVVTAGRLLCLENDNAFDVRPRAMHLLWYGVAVSNGGGYPISPRSRFCNDIQMTPYFISSCITDQHASGSRKQFLSISSIRVLNNDARSVSGRSSDISQSLTRAKARSICENDELINDRPSCS